MRVEIDQASGFCNGVVTAIRKAEQELDSSNRLYCLGDIVHNSDEVERLCSRGLVTITHDDLHSLHGVKVLLRAHGEPPSTYATAKANEIDIIDATCPVVLHLQKRIRESYDRRSPGQQIVIYGKRGHAEVNGLVGQTDGEAVVVEDVAGLDRLDFNRDIILYSQTTKSVHGFHEMIREIERRKSPDARFEYVDTICRQVANRVPQLRAFAAEHEVILFVSGRKSSNGRFLYGECHDVNPLTYFISNPDEIQSEWISEVESIGICGATSTPRWLMEQVRDRVNQLKPNG
ncbi:4-hydroxy-3-methylbut-2-enyl diphosphate reductase [Muribaculum sp.]|uniref:4-hydroxy-3-methylbut-2-enyl diphosphate reductase n=1 Tax=Muribaculum sp. TaxID=1918611 RepID=UPI0023C2BB3D|nr:4-hydroxy-3-methylbut-2-enyl diphosphate reductase [Muribaculum sp.]MDE5706390.1 4-hydroxy-3-methylbut-2-enyl diphosphate reductase [Muribaculum sp.]